MQMLKLVSPSIEHKQQAIEFVREFEKYNSAVEASGSLDRYLDLYEEWLVKLSQRLNKETLKENRVPDSTFFAVRLVDNYIVGIVNIRHELNEDLLQFGGHIGYSTRPTERRKGYATEMLKLSLDVCRSLELNKVLVTCDQDNIGSAKAILSNNGCLENEVIIEGRNKTTQRYWINI